MKKIGTFLVAAIFVAGLQAQEHTAFKIFHNHLALSVKDVNRSADFYRSVMMLPEITNRSAIEGIRWFALSDGTELHLISVIKENVIVNKALHIGLTTEGFDVFLKRLVELKIPYSDWPGKANTVNIRADGIKQIFFQDPDGYWIEVNSVGNATTSADQVKNEIWQLEENYWKYVKAKDFESYLNLWDENFIGYPSTNKIGGKDHITDWITDMYKGRKSSFDYELTRHIENVFGDIVIVLYDATQLWKNEKGEVLERSTFKLTHTWKKTARGWHIIGGMGAKK
jgi:ketosteroid isomerase-like protein/catechol 2,3-dioxygenase-like lactoylglutathione lyase family enzyme